MLDASPSPHCGLRTSPPSQQPPPANRVPSTASVFRSAKPHASVPSRADCPSRAECKGDFLVQPSDSQTPRGASPGVPQPRVCARGPFRVARVRSVRLRSGSGQAQGAHGCPASPGEARTCLG